MSVPLNAVDRYLGRNGQKRHNCAEAVVEALGTEFPLAPALKMQFRSCGGGRAPEGVCGALYGMTEILKVHAPQRLEQAKKDFQDKCGDVRCHEIRKLGKMPCTGCVETAVEAVCSKER